jgi:hypothetical protein
LARSVITLTIRPSGMPTYRVAGSHTRCGGLDMAAWWSSTTRSPDGATWRSTADPGAAWPASTRFCLLFEPPWSPWPRELDGTCGGDEAPVARPFLFSFLRASRAGSSFVLILADGVRILEPRRGAAVVADASASAFRTVLGLSAPWSSSAFWPSSGSPPLAVSSTALSACCILQSSTGVKQLLMMHVSKGPIGTLTGVVGAYQIWKKVC